MGPIPKEWKGSATTTFDCLAKAVLENKALAIEPSTVQSSKTALEAFRS